MQNFSRRALFLKVGQANQASVPAQDSAPLPYQLLAPEHEEFEPSLFRHFPEVQQRQEFQQLRQFAVVLKNTSEQHIRAYHINWTYTDSSSPDFAGKFLAEFMQPHASVLSRSLHVPAGQLRLVSPFFNVKPGDVTSSNFFVSPTLLKNRPLQRAQRSSVTADSVIFSNGHHYGADTSGMGKRYAAMRNGERDEALSIKFHSSKGPNPWDAASVDALLLSHISESRDHLKHDLEEVWWMSRRTEAERLRKRLALKGVGLVQECVERRLRYGQVRLTRKTLT